MFYELRIYDIVPGRMKVATDRIANHAVRYWKKYGITAVLFTEPVFGESPRLVYLLKWETLAEREAKWDPFVSDPEWLGIKNESEKDGPVVARITNMMLKEIPAVATLMHQP